MDLRNVSSLIEYLKAHQLRLNKGLSQNFLIEKPVIERLIKAANIQKGDLVLEIGPGLGAITRTLLESGANVYAVEKDKGFSEALPNILEEWESSLEVVHGDILQTIIDKPMKVVSNIPFQITSPIVTMLANNRHLFSDIAIVIQDDMATRMQSKNGSKQNNSFAIYTQFFFTIKPLFKISNSCFFPKPKIDCAAISLTRKEKLLLPNREHEAFFIFVRKCFKHKRKMLRSSNKVVNIGELLPKIGLKETARAENLSLDHFVSLFLLVSASKKENRS